MSSFDSIPFRTSIAFIVVVVAILANVSKDDDDAIVIFEGGINVPAPHHLVAAYLCELVSLPRWFPGILAVRPQENMDGSIDPLGPGKTYDEAMEIPLIGKMMTSILVTSYEPNAHVGFVLDRWWLPHVQINIDDKTKDRKEPLCKAQVIISSRRSNLLFKFIAAPILRLVHGQTIRQALFNLRFQLHHEMIGAKKVRVPTPSSPNQ